MQIVSFQMRLVQHVNSHVHPNQEGLQLNAAIELMLLIYWTK